MSPKTRTFAAGAFAVCGVFAATWMLFGPAIERWWKTPKPRPIEHIVVETELDPPNYTVMSAGGGDALARAVEQIQTALRDQASDDARVRSALSSTDRAEIAREATAYLHAIMSGDREMYISWVSGTGAASSVLDSPDTKDAQDFLKLWTMNGSGFVGAPVDASGARIRVRYLNGRGPFDAPEDDLLFGSSSSPIRFPGLPKEGGRMAAIVETIIPVMHIDKEKGVASNTLLGFWMARHKPGDPWRLWRIALYDFERPSKAWVPVF